MTRRATSRAGAGFTLMELLVVLAVIAIILSLMLPALQASREAARRSSCINSLRQLGLALQNYEYINQVLPPGVVDTRGPIHNRPEGLHIGWIVQLLPFMEQNGVYNAIDTNVSVYDPANATGARVRINTLLCPSDLERGVPRGVMMDVSFAACHHDVEAPIDVDNHGVFFLNSRVRHEDIPDGSSFTFFVGEKRLQVASSGGWMSGTRATLRNTGTPINAAPEPGGDLVGGYSSYHPGGANFAFGDASVRFLSERIDPHVYRLLGHRADGEMIDDALFNP
ncbi:MAG: DUF1559 domain-containing protein [Planctomycetia bacterium]|nr:DUF1559 domain-containing protein [Planctomycetia bacterium]